MKFISAFSIAVIFFTVTDTEAVNWKAAKDWQAELTGAVTNYMMDMMKLLNKESNPAAKDLEAKLRHAQETTFQQLQIIFSAIDEKSLTTETVRSVFANLLRKVPGFIEKIQPDLRKLSTDTKAAIDTMISEKLFEFAIVIQKLIDLLEQ